MAEHTEFQQRAAALAIVKMLNHKHFDICTLDSIAKTLDVKGNMAGRDYDALRAVHCIDYADMGPELANMVRQKAVELLGIPDNIIDSVCTKEPEKPQQTANKLRLMFWKKG